MRRLIHLVVWCWSIGQFMKDGERPVLYVCIYLPSVKARATFWWSHNAINGRSTNQFRRIRIHSSSWFRSTPSSESRIWIQICRLLRNEHQSYMFVYSPSSYVRLFRARSISIYISLSHPSQISNGSLDHTYHLPLPSRLRENQRESDLSGLKQIAGCVKVKGRGYLQEIGTRMPIRPRQSRQMHEVEKLDRRM